MKASDTSMGGTGDAFPSTCWSVLGRLRGPVTPDQRPHLERLVASYWKPVYCLIRHAWSKGNEEAKDLTQEFFLTAVLEGDLVRKFEPERGTFRAYLRAAVLNFLRDDARSAGRLKRGGEARVGGLQVLGFDVSEVVPDHQARTPEEVFDAAWRTAVLSRSVEILEGRLRAQGKQVVFEVFRRYDLDPADGVSYRSIAEALGITEDSVKNHLTLARKGLREAVVAAVSETVDNEKDLDAELSDLLADGPDRG